MTGGIIRIAVEAIEVCGPGLTDWDTSEAVLAGCTPYRAAQVVLQPPAQLSPAERRRAIASVKLALAVGAAAVERCGRDPDDIAGGVCLPLERTRKPSPRSWRR